MQVGAGGSGPKTESPVWLAPRAVDSLPLTIPSAPVNPIYHLRESLQSALTIRESEKFLFYRGVGRIDAPLRVSRDEGMLQIRSQLPPALVADSALVVPRLWLADIRGPRCA